jgi:glutathione S-transferase
MPDGLASDDTVIDRGEAAGASADIEVISSSTCPFAQRTRMVLAAKGVPFSLTEISLDDKPDWFRKLSPYGKVPILRHGKNVLWESSVINEYLEEVFPEPAMLPKDRFRRALARVWIDFANVRMVPHVYKFMLRQDRDGQELQRERLTEAVVFMERQGLRELSDGPFWMGDTPNLVDFTFFPHVQRFVVLARYRSFAIPPECTRLLAWIEAMHRVPAVKTTRPSDETLICNWSKYAYNTGTGVTAREMREA